MQAYLLAQPRVRDAPITAYCLLPTAY